jgi:hypothetical protein
VLSPAHVEAYRQRFGDHLYHVAPAEALTSILSEGLGGPSAAPQSELHLLRPGTVYLCTWWTALHTGLDEWGDVVLSVPVADLDPSLFVGDADNYRVAWLPVGDYSHAGVAAAHPEMDNDDEVAAMLLQDSGTVAYTGPVPPELLRVAYFVGRADLPHLDVFIAGP